MRWTDLPRDRESAGDRDMPVVQRGEWEDLRRRLERLPAGHPSSLDDEGDVEENGADAGLAEDGRADEHRGDEAGDRRAGRSGPTGPDRPAGPAGGHETGRAPGPGRREPYRPWFASGDSPEPWFSRDSDA